MRRRAVVGVAVAAMVAGCGGADPDKALRDTSRNLSKIQSGNLSMRFVMRPADGPGVGFRLRGPFSLQRDARLPIARMTYTQIAGERKVPATLISTGTRAFVSVDGTTYRLPPDRADALRIVAPGADGLDGLQLNIGRWLREPESSDGPEVGGDETDRITGRLRIGPALHDVFSAARKAGSGARVPSAEDIGQLDGTITDSSIELLTGKKDRLLRRVRLNAEFDVPKRLRTQLGTAAQLRLEFELGVERPNRRVKVNAPSRSQPLP